MKIAKAPATVPYRTGAGRGRNTCSPLTACQWNGWDPFRQGRNLQSARWTAPGPQDDSGLAWCGNTGLEP